MKRFVTLCLVLPLIFGKCTDKSISKEQEKQDLAVTVAEFNTAFQSGNKALIASFIAKDYIHTNSTSKAIDRRRLSGNYGHTRRPSKVLYN